MVRRGSEKGKACLASAASCPRDVGFVYPEKQGGFKDLTLCSLGKAMPENSPTKKHADTRRQTNTHRERQTQRETHTDTHAWTDAGTDTHTDIDTRHTDRHTNTHHTQSLKKTTNICGTKFRQSDY